MQNHISNKTIEKLKYDLVRNKLISYDDLIEAQEFAKKNQQNLAQVLIEKNFISEETLLKFIQDNLHIPFVNLEDYSLDENCLSFITVEDARRYKVLPLFKIENVLTVAMADPLDLFVINNLIKCIKCDIEPIICSERLILEFIERYYVKKKHEEVVIQPSEGLVIDWREELNEESPDTVQIEKIINSIISQALLEDVFEVIFENTSEGINVKFRKFDQIENKGVIPYLLSSSCVSHIKTLSGLDNLVFDVPQLGKFTYQSDIEYVTGIVSTFPLVNGERIVVKLYHPPKVIDDLPIKAAQKEIIRESLEKPGIILIAGPRLSGKSFMAYSILNSLNGEDKNIMTIESIVKYDLRGINQCELREKVGFNKEKALKYIDFQSPDIIYFEEFISEKFLVNFVKTGKLIITEMSAKNTDEAENILAAENFSEIREFLNCIIFADNEKIFVSV